AHCRAVADDSQHLRTQPDQLLGVDHQLPPARRRQHHAAIPLQQFDADLAFELGDPLRDRGLGGVEFLRGAPEAAERYHPHESLNCLEISHAPSACTLIIKIYRIRLEKTIRHYHSHMREWMSTGMGAGTTMTGLARTDHRSHDTANLSP